VAITNNLHYAMTKSESFKFQVKKIQQMGNTWVCHNTLLGTIRQMLQPLVIFIQFEFATWHHNLKVTKSQHAVIPQIK
jgi:N-acetylglucosamine-6-phosphate deacetylase